MSLIDRVFAKEAKRPTSPILTRKHRVLIVNPPADPIYRFHACSEVMTAGVLAEACSWNALCAHYKEWASQIDILIIGSAVILSYNPLTVTLMKTALTYLMDAGVMVIWFCSSLGTVMAKRNNVGTYYTPADCSDLFNNLTWADHYAFSGIECIHSPAYDLDYEILRPGLLANTAYLVSFASTDSSVKYPLQVTDGTNTSNVVAYCPGKFFAIVDVGGDPPVGTIAGYRYAYCDAMITQLYKDKFGDDFENVRLAQDLICGSIVVAPGWDLDVTATSDWLTSVNTTLYAGVSAGATAIQTPVNFAVGAVLSIDTTNTETRIVRETSGESSPYTLTLDVALVHDHSTGCAIGQIPDCTGTLMMFDAINEVNPLIPIEVGLTCKADTINGSIDINQDIANWYNHYLPKIYNVQTVLHAYNHFRSTTTITDEIHTIPSNQIVHLYNTCKATITYIKTIDDITTFTDDSGTDYDALDSGNPAAGEYVINKLGQTYSVDGRIRFNSSDVGKVIKIKYTCCAYTDEEEYIYGHTALEAFTGIMKKATYMTSGFPTIATLLKAFADDHVLCDYVDTSNIRLRNIIDMHTNKIPLLHGFNFVHDIVGTGNCDDMDLIQGHSREGAEGAIDLAILLMQSLEQPIIFFCHDIAINGRWGRSVYNLPGLYNADWPKADLAATQANLRLFYKNMFTKLNNLAPYWMPRSDYCKRYYYMNQYIAYDFEIRGSRILITVQNNGKEKLNGLTFRVPTSAEPSSVSLLGYERSAIPYSYSSGLTLLWFDLPAGTAVTVEVDL